MNLFLVLMQIVDLGCLLDISKVGILFWYNVGNSGKEKVFNIRDTENHIFLLDLKNNLGKLDSHAVELEKNVSNIMYNYYLFAKNDCGNDSINYPSKFKMKYCKIFDNNLLIRDYIPCSSTTSVANADGYTVPTNTKGLYDLVEGKFYTNANTAEDAVDFTAGPQV